VAQLRQSLVEQHDKILKISFYAPQNSTDHRNLDTVVISLKWMEDEAV